MVANPIVALSTKRARVGLVDGGAALAASHQFVYVDGPALVAALADGVRFEHRLHERDAVIPVELSPLLRPWP